jgi:hypothetical protein
MANHTPLHRFGLFAATLIIVVGVSVVGSNANGTPPNMAELWEAPNIERRNLLHGPGGADLAPDPDGRYELLEEDKKGFSPGYDVRDASGRTWSVKLGPEARTEVVVSRLVWAVGYRQPDVYYVPGWKLSDKGKVTAQGPARFRLEDPDRPKSGAWSWRENPFIGTRQFSGLFALMVIVNNWDVKTSQNALYRISTNGDSPRQWYVVRDVGASLGKTNWFFPGNRDDVGAFEKEPFIKSVEGNRVKFHYKGAWLEPQLNNIVTPGDLVWICELLSQLSPRQWNDAFRAGGYTDAEASRYIKRLRQKIDDGLRLKNGTLNTAHD